MWNDFKTSEGVKLVSWPMRQARRGREEAQPTRSLDYVRSSPSTTAFFVSPRASDEDTQRRGSNNDSDECLGRVFRKYQTKKLVQEEQQAGCDSFEFRGLPPEETKLVG